MKTNLYIKVIISKIVIFCLLIIYSTNSNSQISNLIPSDRLPPAPTTPIPDCDCDEGGICHWVCAGSPVLISGIFVKECINVTEQGVIYYTGDLNYQTYDPTCPNSDIINSLT